MESAWKARRRQRRGIDIGGGGHCTLYIDIGGGGGGEPRAERCIESGSIRQGKARAIQTSRAAEQMQTAAVFSSAAEGESEQQS